MRWTLCKEEFVEIGAIRTVRRFLFLPTKPYMENEWRWLEWAYIVQMRALSFWFDHKWAKE